MRVTLDIHFLGPDQGSRRGVALLRVFWEDDQLLPGPDSPERAEIEMVYKRFERIQKSGAGLLKICATNVIPSGESDLRVFGKRPSSLEHIPMRALSDRQILTRLFSRHATSSLDDGNSKDPFDTRWSVSVMISAFSADVCVCVCGKYPF